MAQCHFNARYEISMRRNIRMDRNRVAEEREAWLEFIDYRRKLHKETTGCNCWEEALKKMDAEVDV